MARGTEFHVRDGSCTRPVGVGELAVSRDPYEVLTAYSLGSCVGLSLYDPVARVGGLLHAQLPLSRMDANQAASWPARFTDTGTTKLLQKVYDMGAKRDRLVAKAVGGASMLDEEGRFRIGERNATVLRKVLWKNNIVIAATDLGGTLSRTLYLHIDDGATRLRIAGRVLPF